MDLENYKEIENITQKLSDNQKNNISYTGYIKDEFSLAYIYPHIDINYYFVTVITNGKTKEGTRGGIHKDIILELLQQLKFDYNKARWGEFSCIPTDYNEWFNYQKNINKKTNLYFIQSEIGGPIKIGISDDVEERLKTFQTGCPYILKIIGIIKNVDIKYEKVIHKKFNKYRLHNEWFQECEEIYNFIKNNKNIKIKAYKKIEKENKKLEEKIKLIEYKPIKIKYWKPEVLDKEENLTELRLESARLNLLYDDILTMSDKKNVARCIATICY